ASGLALLLHVRSGDAAGGRCIVRPRAAPGGEGTVLRCDRPGCGLQAGQVAAVLVAGGGAWVARRRDRRAAVGRAVVLRRRSVAQAALFCGGGYDLSGLTSHMHSRLSRIPFDWRSV